MLLWCQRQMLSLYLALDRPMSGRGESPSQLRMFEHVPSYFYKQLIAKALQWKLLKPKATCCRREMYSFAKCIVCLCLVFIAPYLHL
jgi:hypothetical protein